MRNYRLNITRRVLQDSYRCGLWMRKPGRMPMWPRISLWWRRWTPVLPKWELMLNELSYMTKDPPLSWSWSNSSWTMERPYMVGVPLERDFSFGKNGTTSSLSWILLTTIDEWIFLGANGRRRNNGMVSCPMGAAWIWVGIIIDLQSFTNTKTSGSLKAAIPFKSIRYKKGISEWGIKTFLGSILKIRKIRLAPVSTSISPRHHLPITGIQLG